MGTSCHRFCHGPDPCSRWRNGHAHENQIFFENRLDFHFKNLGVFHQKGMVKLSRRVVCYVSLRWYATKPRQDKMCIKRGRCQSANCHYGSRSGVSLDQRKFRTLIVDVNHELDWFQKVFPNQKRHRNHQSFQFTYDCFSALIQQGAQLFHPQLQFKPRSDLASAGNQYRSQTWFPLRVKASIRKKVHCLPYITSQAPGFPIGDPRSQQLHGIQSRLS